MSNEDFERVMYAVNCLRGEVAAQRAASDALIGTICTLHPGCNALLMAHLEVTSRIHQTQLPEEAARVMDACVAELRQLAAAVP